MRRGFAEVVTVEEGALFHTCQDDWGAPLDTKSLDRLPSTRGHESGQEDKCGWGLQRSVGYLLRLEYSNEYRGDLGDTKLGHLIKNS